MAFTHHAYLVEGPLSDFERVVQAVLKMGDTAAHDPDVAVRRVEKFGIDESRELKELAALKSVSGTALCIVGVSQITTEAQQALLKLFEEPPAGVVFVLMAPHGVLLPTLLSRLLPLSIANMPTDERGAARAFLQAPYKKRTDTIAALLKDEEETKDAVRSFVNAIEAVLYASLKQTPDNRELVRGLADAALVRGYLGDRSASLKMLLEHLAAVLPRL